MQSCTGTPTRVVEEVDFAVKGGEVSMRPADQRPEVEVLTAAKDKDMCSYTPGNPRA